MLLLESKEPTPNDDISLFSRRSYDMVQSKMDKDVISTRDLTNTEGVMVSRLLLPWLYYIAQD